MTEVVLQIHILVYIGLYRWKLNKTRFQEKKKKAFSVPEKPTAV